MCAILIERERLGGAGIDLGTSAFDLGVPRQGRVRVRGTIEARKELEGPSRSFFGGEPKDPCQHVRSRHDPIIAGLALATSTEVGKPTT